MAYTKSRRKGKGERVSAYAKKRRLGLVPHRYSAEYHAWSEAVKRSDASAISRTSEAHQLMIVRRFGPPARLSRLNGETFIIQPLG